ncbi:tRNA(Ile)-lysidine synthase [bacterium BMS3Bbin03]|nr:tRNA(Ile)-lysidine synthase [bacterium BMS3Bbin03]
MKHVFHIIQEFQNYSAEHHLIQPEDRILAAVSGGVDSVVLFDLLFKIKAEFNLSLKMIHLNHLIRGEESNRDAAFVRELARKYEVEAIFEKRDAPDYRRRNKLSLEEAAREIRYQFYEDLIQRTGFNKVALGHQQNDQVETILENFLRGTGIRGLGGIPVKRGPFIRPLLWASREDLVRYAQEEGLQFREDSSNRDTAYRRNRIRHELLPYLKEHFNPQIVNSINRLGIIFAETETFLSQVTFETAEACILEQNHSKIILDIHRFSDYFNIVKKYILRDLLKKMGVSDSYLTFEKYRALLDLAQERRNGRRVMVSPDVEVLLDHSGLVIRKYPDQPDVSIRIKFGLRYTLPGSGLVFRMQVSENPSRFRQFSNDPNVEWIDFERIKGRELRLRNWCKGDRFVPLGMKDFKKISDFLIDGKIPFHKRKEILVLTADEDIVWVCGYRLDDRFKVTEAAKKGVKLILQKIRSRNAR